jgi:hypothetical protein
VVQRVVVKGHEFGGDLLMSIVAAVLMNTRETD